MGTYTDCKILAQIWVRGREAEQTGRGGVLVFYPSCDPSSVHTGHPQDTQDLSPSKKTMKCESAKVHEALDKGKKSLSKGTAFCTAERSCHGDKDSPVRPDKKSRRCYTHEDSHSHHMGRQPKIFVARMGKDACGHC